MTKATFGIPKAGVVAGMNLVWGGQKVFREKVIGSLRRFFAGCMQDVSSCSSGSSCFDIESVQAMTPLR